MAKKTMELTTQVEPKRRASCTTPLVSRSMNPAPRKNIDPFGRHGPTGAKSTRITIDATATMTIPRMFNAGTLGSRGRGTAGCWSRGSRSIPVVSTSAGAKLDHPPGEAVRASGGFLPKPLTARFTWGFALARTARRLRTVPGSAPRFFVVSDDQHGDRPPLRLAGGDLEGTVRERQYDGLRAENLLRHLGNPPDHPPLAEVVVDDEEAVGLQPRPDIAEGFLGK